MYLSNTIAQAEHSTTGTKEQHYSIDFMSVPQATPITYNKPSAASAITNNQAVQLSYNQAGRLDSVNIDDVLVAEYRYNYQGLRSHKIRYVGGTVYTTVYLYDESGRLWIESDDNGTPLQHYVWSDRLSPDAVLAQGDISQIHYLHLDHLGTARVATDTAQNVTWQWQGNAFGDVSPIETGVTINLRFPGQYYDEESGLHYNWHRYYDPELGRYITSDPIGLGGGVNSYSYVYNRPLRYIDPYGLEAWVNAYPNDQGGFSFTAHDDQGSSSISGNFNNDTTNINQVLPGVYSVSPRPELPNTLTNRLLNRNENAGNPTISNTDDWNTIQYPDGSITTGAQFHEGRNGTPSGTSLACMVSDRGTNNALNEMFSRNYNNGGVTLTIFPSGWLGP